MWGLDTQGNKLHTVYHSDKENGDAVLTANAGVWRQSVNA
jgi:hypothetical protein